MDRTGNLRILYIHEACFFLSQGMVGVILPVLLLELFDSVAAVFLWHLCWQGVQMTCFIPALNIGLNVKNPTYVMGAGMLFMAMSLACLVAAPSYPLLVVPSALLYGLYVGTYWPVRHWVISCCADHEQVGRQVSNLYTIRTICDFIAPVVGGLVGGALGLSSAMWVGFLFCIPAFLLILGIKQEPNYQHYGLKEVKRVLERPENRATRVAFVFEALCHYATTVPWVLIFILYLGDITQLGIFLGFSTLIGALLCQYTGRMFDRIGRGRLLDGVTHLRAISVLLYTVVILIPFCLV